MITVNMIVGRFEEPFLQAAINSVSSICEDVVIVDTAVGNNPNKNMMKATGARIIEYRNKHMDFAEARNMALEASSTDWIIKLDADEVFQSQYLPRMETIVKATEASAIEISFWHHFLHPDLYRIDQHKKCVLIRRDKLRWELPVHEQSRIEGEILKVHDIYFNHYGYVKPQSEIRKRWALYDSLGNGPPGGMEGIPEDGFLDELMPELLYYKGEHPAAVIPKLRELFPDLGKFKKPE